MPRKDISSLSQRELALTVLSKLLYAVTDRTPGAEEIKFFHSKILNESLNESHLSPGTEKNNTFSIQEIPWDNLLDSISSHNPFIISLIRSQRFSIQEIRYMCAIICGLSGKEYGLITGFKSHYNLSWSIRQKFGMPHKTINIRNFLQELSENAKSETQQCNVQK